MEQQLSLDNKIIWPVVTRGIVHQQPCGIAMPDGETYVLPERYEEMVQEAVAEIRTHLRQTDVISIGNIARDIHSAARAAYQAHQPETADDAVLGKRISEAVASAMTHYVPQAA